MTPDVAGVNDFLIGGGPLGEALLLVVSVDFLTSSDLAVRGRVGVCTVCLCSPDADEGGEGVEGDLTPGEETFSLGVLLPGDGVLPGRRGDCDL